VGRTPILSQNFLNPLDAWAKYDFEKLPESLLSLKQPTEKGGFLPPFLLSYCAIKCMRANEKKIYKIS
jgi:hypothetical protein